MALFENFIEKAFHEEGNFILQNKEGGTSFTLFIPVKFKMATFILGSISYGKEKFYIDLGRGSFRDFQLAAVKYKDQIAIYSDSLVGAKSPYGTYLNHRIVSWEELCRQITLQVKTDFFDRMILNLEPTPLDESIEITCRMQARKFLIEGREAMLRYLPEDILMTESDVSCYLSDALDVEKHCEKVFEEYKEHLSYQKTFWKRYNELISEEKERVVSEWELRLANDLKSINGKKVNVTFYLNDKTAAGKISIEKLLYRLFAKDRIHYYDFPTDKEGEDVFAALGLLLQEDLYCKDIVKITFARKIIYMR